VDLLVPKFEEDTSRVIYWEHQGNWAVRKGPWKLMSVVYKKEPAEVGLYNLEQDPAELHDLKNEFPEKTKELHGLYKTWAERVGVMPFDSLILARPI
jgi:arylsulfatase